MLTSGNRQQKRPRRPSRQLLILEVLEDRTLLSASPTASLDPNALTSNAAQYSSTDTEVDPFQVTNTNDSGVGSLRQAIINADASPGANTVVFSSLFNTPQTITLTSGSLTLTNAATTTISGPGASLLTVSGNNQSRVFSINSGAAAEIDGLTITGGNGNARDRDVGYGGGIISDGTLALNDDVVTGNTARIGGGICSAFGALTLKHTTVSNNTAQEAAGLYVQSEPATIGNSTISNNAATRDTGGMRFVNVSVLTITNTTIADNTANFDDSAVRIIGYNSDLPPGSGGFFATFLNDTISGNTVARAGGTGGIALINTSALTSATNAKLTNTIVSGNTSGGSPADLSGLFDRASSYNLIGTGAIDPVYALRLAGRGNIIGVNNPLLAPLGNYGGPTQTMALLDGSPARKAGDPNVLVTTDQRGLPRTAGSVDIGAYQTQDTSTTLSSSSGTSDSGQSVTFTAVVTNTSTATPSVTAAFSDRATALSTGTLSGIVTFFDNGTELGNSPLRVVNGVDEATFTTSTLAVGNHRITATYDGDDYEETSTGSLTETVDAVNQINNSNPHSILPGAGQSIPSLPPQFSEGISTLLQGMSVFGQLPLLLSNAGSLTAATDLFSSALDLVGNEVPLYVDVILGESNQLLGLSTSLQGEQLAAGIAGLVDALHANPLFNRV